MDKLGEEDVGVAVPMRSGGILQPDNATISPVDDDEAGTPPRPFPLLMPLPLPEKFSPLGQRWMAFDPPASMDR